MEETVSNYEAKTLSHSNTKLAATPPTQNSDSLPDGWRWVRLGDVCDFVGGGTPSKKESKYWNGKLNWASVKDVKGDFLNSTEDTITELGLNNSASNVAEPNDLILITRISPGKSIITNVRTAVNQDLKIVRPKFQTSSKFLHYYFQAIGREVIKKSSGTTVLGITLNNLNEILIPLLDPVTQHAIVSKIEELFSELDKGKQQLETARQQLKIYRQAVLKWAFEGKLSELGRVGLKDDRITGLDNQEEILPSTNPKNPNSDNELPEGWKWVKIEEIADVGTGATPLKSNKSFYENGRIAWVTSGALNDEFVRTATDFVTEKALKETNLSVYPKGTLLLAMYGEGKTRGKCSELLIEATTNQAIAAISFKKHDSRVKPYLKYFLLKNYNDIRMLSSGGVQPNLNLGIVKKTLIPFPSIEEQHRIVQEIESRLSVCDKVEETITNSLAQAETLRQSILKKAFEGKLSER